MAKLAREKYLVLLVDDAAYDCVSIQMSGPACGGLEFMGSISDGQELITYLQQGGDSDEQPCVPLVDLLVLGLMMPHQEGAGMVQWLQSQPFEGVTVVLLEEQAEPAGMPSAASC